MAKDQGAKRPTPRSKSRAYPAGAAKPPTVSAPEPKKRVGLAQFAKEVRNEGKKVTWTSWKETWISSLQVFIVVALMSLFFLMVDGVISFVIQQLLRMASF